MGRKIALKELSNDASSREATVNEGNSPCGTTPRIVRFLREARITAQLEHPAIVPIHELGRRTDGTLYYTMKLIRGRTLDQAIEEAGSLSGRLDLLPYSIDWCQATAYAHSRGVIHRDFKPSNVLVGSSARPWLSIGGLPRQKGQPGRQYHH